MKTSSTQDTNRPQLLKYSVALLAAIFLLSACAGPGRRSSRDLVQETRDVNNFDRISLRAPGDLFITQTGDESLSIETNSDVMDHVYTKVRNGTLIIEVRGMLITSPTELIFNVTVDELSEIDISSSGDIYIDDLETDRLLVENSGSGDIRTDDIDTERIEIEIRGSGDLKIDSLSAETTKIILNGSGRIQIEELTTETLDTKLNSSGAFRVDTLEADEIKMVCNGSGNIDLAGEVQYQDISIRGSAKYDAGDLISETVDINLGSSGNVKLWVTDYLDVHIGGSGDVSYYGRPMLNFSGNGSGALQNLGDK